MMTGVLLLAAFGVVGLSAPDLTPLAAENVRIGSGPALTVFDGGGIRLPVVFDDDPRAEKAASYLASALTEMSGVACEQYRLTDGMTNTFARCIRLPRPDDGDAFAVEVSDRGVGFSGRTDFAAYDFCERLLGVRHYWDGPGGRSVPKRDSLELPPLAYSDAPVFSFRRYSSNGEPAWFRVAKGGGTFDGWARCHTTDAGFCFGSPEGFAEFCRRTDADIAGGARFGRVVDRDRRTVSVSPADVAYDCRCPWCSTLRAQRGPVSGRMTSVLWDRFLTRFSKYMAARHPDYRVCVLPYWNYVRAPEAGLATNVFAEVCSMSGLASFKCDWMRELEEGIILDWERATGRPVANWHYSCWPADYTSAAYVYGKTIAEHYRRMRGHTVGSFVCGGKRDFPRFSLSLYVWMRCLWNPELDVASVYDEFCVRQFGPASAKMRELIAIQEDEWNPQTRLFPRAAMIRMAECLNASARLVQGTPFRRTFDYYAHGFDAMFEQR